MWTPLKVKRTNKVLRESNWHHHHQFELKETKTFQNEERTLDPLVSMDRKQADKFLSCKHGSFLTEKQRYLPVQSQELWRHSWTREPLPEMRRTRPFIILPRRGRRDNGPQVRFQNAFSLPLGPLLFKRECPWKLSCSVSHCTLRCGNRWLFVLAHRSLNESVVPYRP